MRRLIALVALSGSVAVPLAVAQEPPPPTCHGLAATHVGTAAGETIKGTFGDDVIVGLGGDDVIRGKGGNDTICAGSGSDEVYGGAGKDWIDAGAGSDIVFGGTGRDRIGGSTGGDEIAGGRGRDHLLGGGGADTARGGHGPDTCSGFEEDHSCLLGVVLTEVAQLPTGHKAGIAVSPPGDHRLFLVDQTGPIWQVGPSGIKPTPLLDLTGRVSQAYEEGVLGLAFHPDYQSNGRFFVFSTQTDMDVVVQEFTDDGDWPIDPASGTTVIEIDHGDATNHNGGMLQFGPDGYLYVSVGDGGTGGANGQDVDVLLGKILRLDVDSASPYANPPDNPFVGKPGKNQIWAYGLRNPWRFSFDPPAGLLYVGDVGQGSYEEIDVVAADLGGVNFGWSAYEGNHCYTGPCSASGKTFPVVEVPHSDSGTCSIIGGFAYRGARLPELEGHYLYGDFCGGWIRSFLYSDGVATHKKQWLDTGGNFTSFGTDADGEVYIATTAGDLFRIDPVR